jgi:glycosyltransferase involved in cell wall biosynthesis
MNILEVIPSVDGASGGPIEWTRQFAAVALADGHTVEMASLDSPEAPYVRNFPLPVYALGPGKLPPYGYAPRFVPWLRENADRYDVVVVNGIWAFHSFGTWRVLRNSETPYFVFTHGMLDPWFKREYPLKHAKKWLYWPWAEYRVLRDASAVLFTCEEEKILARQSFPLYRAHEVNVGNGTAGVQGDASSQMELFFSRCPGARGKRIALFMGRIHPKKGCDLVVEAFSKAFGRNADWYLVMAGPDQIGLRQQLMDRARSLGLAERITWPGLLSGGEKWGAMRAAEMFLLPSHQENFGLVVAEALSCGLPPLISDKINIWREIQDDGAGIVASDDIEGATETCLKWTAMSTDERSSMRRRARECFLRRFEIESVSRSLLAFLSQARRLNPATGFDRRRADTAGV